MARSKSSGQWLQEHFSDRFVQRSQKEGYRSRASYKLTAIQEKDRIFKHGMSVVDLGSAPGGWSQVAGELIGGKGTIVASDILDMAPIPDVTFVKGDFTEESVLNEILAKVGTEKVDLVISDMAPNMSGVPEVDQPRSMYLNELALDLATQILTPGGTFLTKVFQGEGFDQFYRDMRGNFDKLVTRKPEASRQRSREVYLLGKGFKAQG